MSELSKAGDGPDPRFVASEDENGLSSALREQAELSFTAFACRAAGLCGGGSPISYTEMEGKTGEQAASLFFRSEILLFYK